MDLSTYREGPVNCPPQFSYFLGGRFSLLGRLFSLLGASWPHFATLAAFVVALGRFWWAPGRSGLDFGGSRAGPGKVWEALRPYFAMLFRACNRAMRNQPERRFVLEKPIRN